MTGPSRSLKKRWTARGAALVRRLLAFARQQPIAPRTYNAKQVVAGMEELLQRTLGGSIEINMRLAGKPCLIQADPNELENVVLNLAINGRDAMVSGGRLELSIDNLTLGTGTGTGRGGAAHDLTQGDYIVIAVSDTGSGMPPEVVERAFEPFFTTKQFGGGSGLGLSMVYGFARRSGGKVEINSELESGTTVRIYLPRVVASASVAAEAQPTQQQVPKGNERVLVVEDEPAVRHLATTMLRHLGYEVVDAGDGPSAMRLLEGTGVDLMLTDVDLPGGTNGIDLAGEARRLRPALAVLLMSGYPDKALELAGGTGDQYELIAKPFERAELGGMVRATLDRAVDQCVAGERARNPITPEPVARSSQRGRTPINKS